MLPDNKGYPVICRGSDRPGSQRRTAADHYRGFLWNGEPRVTAWVRRRVCRPVSRCWGQMGGSRSRLTLVRGSRASWWSCGPLPSPARTRPGPRHPNRGLQGLMLGAGEVGTFLNSRGRSRPGVSGRQHRDRISRGLLSYRLAAGTNRSRGRRGEAWWMSLLLFQMVVLRHVPEVPRNQVPCRVGRHPAKGRTDRG
jgi:hypothetical protein